MSRQYRSWVYIWKKKNTKSKSHMHPSVHGCTIYNSQDMEATLLPINRWMDKEDAVHVYNGKRQFSSAAWSCRTLCDPTNRSTPGLPVHHQLPEFIQTHVHRVRDAIQPSHPLSSPSPSAPNHSQHQSLFQWVKCCTTGWWTKLRNSENSLSFCLFPALFKGECVIFFQEWKLPYFISISKVNSCSLKN